MASNDVFKSLDAKVGAILTLLLDGYLRQTGVAKPKERSIDKMLTDVGLSAGEIAKLLGKTERAVHLQLAAEREKKKKAKASGTARRSKSTAK